MASYDLIISNGTCVNHDGVFFADIGVRDGRIAAVGGLGQADAPQILSAKGLHILPGVIDSQVHFREPGNEHKEDIETGTRAAVLGGVTAVFEMPNTDPPTLHEADIADKLRRAKGRAWCDIAFFVGADRRNRHDLHELEREPGCAGIKVFLGKSTGNLLVDDDELLSEILASGSRRVAFHSEDNSRLEERKPIARAAAHPRAHPDWRDPESAVISTRRLLVAARRQGRRVHLLHVSTAEEMDIIWNYRDLCTVEVTPNHLTLVAPDCYDELGTLAQMNPPVRDRRHRDALWDAVRSGLVDVVGSDHAPHTREEKAGTYPDTPSGMPGVQTLLPLLLNHVHDKQLPLLRLVDLTSAGPARAYGVVRKGRLAVGYDADLTLVDLSAARLIDDSWIASRCGWTPYHGKEIRGWPMATVVRGNVVMRDDEVLGQPVGEPVRFLESL